MIVIGFLVITGFNMSLPLFTAALFVVMATSGFYVGTISDRYAEINGLIVSVITSTIVLLYVAQYTSMNWSVNQIFIASYLVIGFVSSLISRITNKKHKVKNKLKNKEKNTDILILNERAKTAENLDDNGIETGKSFNKTRLFSEKKKENKRKNTKNS